MMQAEPLLLGLLETYEHTLVAAGWKPWGGVNYSTANICLQGFPEQHQEKKTHDKGVN